MVLRCTKNVEEKHRKKIFTYIQYTTQQRSFEKEDPRPAQRRSL
jgi:hypothetical protein